MKLLTLKPFTIPVVVLATALACTSSGAATAEKPGNFTFRFDRAALSAPGGSGRVYGSLVLEARRACQVLGKGVELWRTNLRNACVASLVDEVVMATGARELVSHHEGTGYYRLARVLEKNAAQEESQQTTARAE
jgi:UrcA family protein